MDRLASLTVFGRVVEAGGFSAAARRLNMSVTMVSNHVQALEDHLGTRLLNRTTRKVSLTEIGRAYHERAVQILAELDEADRLATAQQITPTGRLRVHTNSHIVRFLAPVVIEFLALYPGVSVDLRTGEQMVDLIEDGFDLVIRTSPAPDSSFIVRQLAPWRHVLCCSPAYLREHGTPMTVAELQQHNCLQYAYYPFGDEWRFEAAGGETETVRVSGNLVASNAEILRHAATEGRGIMLAPCFVAAPDLLGNRLIRLLPNRRPASFAISAIYPNRHHLSAKVRRFLDLLAIRFAEHRQWLDLDADARAGAVLAPLAAAE